MENLEQSYAKLMSGNEEWVKEKLALNPNYFTEMATSQSPEFLWIGCADSRVPANEITNTSAGDIFVHRNIANLVVHTDINLMSVLQYAVEVLHVKHVIVCGHYGCGGVKAAMQRKDNGLVNKWIRNIKEVHQKYWDELQAIEDEHKRFEMLVEYNVMEQVHNLAKTSIIQKAWKNREVQIHGWVYGLHDGKIKDLHCMYENVDKIEPAFRFDFL